MTSETDTSHRSLLGLRATAESPQASGAPSQGDTPPRPDYPVISSGWDNEDTGPASKTSDLMTAVRAGLVLLALMVALGLLIR